MFGRYEAMLWAHFLYLNAGAKPNVRLVSLQEVSLQVEYLQKRSEKSPSSNFSNVFQMVGPGWTLDAWTQSRHFHKLNRLMDDL